MTYWPRGGYEAGSKPMSEWKPPPRGVGAGMKSPDRTGCRTCDGQGEWTDSDEDQVICWACGGSG